MPLDPAPTPAELEAAKARVRQREAAAKAHRQSESARTSGVRFGGMSPSPWVDLTEEEVEQSALASIENYRRFLAENLDIAARIAASQAAVAA